MSTLAVAKEVAGRMANDILEVQVNQFSPTFKKMAAKAEKCKGKTHRIHVSNGMQSGTQLIADNGTLPTAGNIGVETIDVAPEAFISRISMGFVASHLADGSDDGLNLFAENAAAAGKSLGVVVGRSILDGYVGGLTATVSSGSVTDTLDDIGGLVEGLVLEGGSDSYTVSSITRTAGSVSGSVAFTTDASDGAKTVDLYLKGWGANNFVSLADASGSGTIYSTAISSAKWQGVQVAAGGALTDSILIDLDSRMEEEAMGGPTAFIMNPATYRELMQGHSSNRRFVNAASEDLFGDYKAKPVALGREVILDPRCPYKKAFAYSDVAVKLGRWHDPKSGDGFLDYQNSPNRAYDVSDSTFAQTTAKVGLFNLLVRNRSGAGQISGITHS